MIAYQIPEETLEAAAKVWAGLSPRDKWPTNEDLGGGPTGTRDDEMKAEAYEVATEMISVVAPLIAAQTLRAFGSGVLDAVGMENFSSTELMLIKSMLTAADSFESERS